MASPPSLVGAIDQGTTSTRFILYRVEGRGRLAPVASHQMEHAQIYPKPGWCEHDPEAIYRNVLTCVDAALSKLPDGFSASDVACVGITNQRETTVCWDAATGAPIGNAVVWLDARTAEAVKALEKARGGADAFRDVCGLPLSTYFAGVKMRWLLDNDPAVAAANEAGTLRFGTMDAWLVHRLTGGAKYVTDVTNASRTMLMRLDDQTWHEPTLAAFGVRRSALPSIVSNAEPEAFGAIAEGALRGVPITGCLGDQHAATLGQRCGVGEAKNTYGTGCFALLNVGANATPSRRGLLSTLAWRLGARATPAFALEGSVAIAGAGVQWLRDNMGLIESASEIEALASSVPDSGGVAFVPAFGGLFAPRWRADARGVIVGLTQHSTKAHVARALLEAIAFQTRDVLDAMRADAALSSSSSRSEEKPDDEKTSFSLETLRVDGGASANALLMQTQADVLGVVVSRPADVETTAMGAALAAGIGAGLWTEEDVFEPEGGDERDAGATAFEPRGGRDERERRYARWCDAVERSLGLA